MLPSPQVGPQRPPIPAIWILHSGPELIAAREKASYVPFALTIPTIRYAVPPMVALKSVGVDPKSSPSTRCETGTCQEPARERLGMCSASSASANGVPEEQVSPLPVAMYRRPVEASIVGDPQIPPP